MADRSVCSVPVRGAQASPDAAPEVGLRAVISQAASLSQETSTDANGVGALFDQAPGFHRLELQSGDQLLHGRLTVELTSRLTWITGWTQRDRDDLDADGDRTEWLLLADVIADADADGISDDGKRELWLFDGAGGVSWRHVSAGVSERAPLDLDYDELAGERFADRDGDFVADDLDDDIDGDGVPNAAEGRSLACPGFSHSQLETPGSLHEPIACAHCHLDHAPPYQCADCHAADGRAWIDSPLTAPAGHFERRCEQCHVADRAWDAEPGPTGEQHLGWAIDGAHLKTDCFDCHLLGDVEGIPDLCHDCHLGDAPPNHAIESCEACHETTAWRPPLVGHETFPLAGGHADLTCTDCHATDSYLGLSTACVSCHQDLIPPKHVDPGFAAQPCDDCHNIYSWNEYFYLHPIWSLEGAHALLTCEDCHADNPSGYTGNQPSCVSCHPTPPGFPDHSGFSNACETCHDQDGWVPATSSNFDHSTWPLLGSHQTVLCGACHEDGALLRPPQNCSGCHQDDRPARHDGTFDGECDDCHLPTAWAELSNGWPHTSDFPLDGAHAAAACAACHPDSYTAPSACVSCHLDDRPANHYGDDCQSCHNTVNWSPEGELNHHEVDLLAFPLLGAHSQLLCSQCHVDGIGPLPRECTACHLSQMPSKHIDPGFSTQPCDDCHQATSWVDFDYPHYIWLLNGQHAAVQCQQCHPGPVTYAGNLPYCSACHSAPPGFPDHSNFGDDCGSCHDENGWVPAISDNIDHSIWPLTDSHVTAPCASCHVDGTVARPATNCSSCHQGDRPGLHAGTFDGECDQCHRPTTWTDLLTPFQHVATFPLDGAHASTPCAACHVSSYQVSPVCVDCHRADAPAGHYGDDCETCHTTSDWNPTGDMNHHSVDPAALPLTGGHAGLLCSQCHGATIGPLDRACESCHSGDRPAGHALAGCADCHDSGSWNVANQPPANATHPLAGRHVGVGCVDCHGAYSPGLGFATPRPSPACEDCHPLPSRHMTVGDPACEACHNVDGWVPALGHTGGVPTAPFDYQGWAGRWFPVPPSAHHGANECRKCHTRIESAGDVRFFSCTTNCHRNSSSLDNKHHYGQDDGGRAFHLYHFDPNASHSPPDEGGAPWPTAHTGCVERSCHPDGREP